jgi:hypothetical protein
MSRWLKQSLWQAFHTWGDQVSSRLSFSKKKWGLAGKLAAIRLKRVIREWMRAIIEDRHIDMGLAKLVDRAERRFVYLSFLVSFIDA